MKLRQLHIRRFRCIEDLRWTLGGDFLCLIGPGDAGKSSLLDAIEFVLSPRWNVTFDDSDFYGADISSPITIDATIGDLPRRFLSDGAFGLRLRGLAPDGTLNDEPQEDDEEVITIRLSVDASLEPRWEVVTDRHPEGAPIHVRDREKLGAVRLGSAVDRHLSWSRGSYLARLTGDEHEHEHAAILTDAGRSARSSIDQSRLGKLADSVTRAGALAEPFGVRPSKKFTLAMDPGLATRGAGGLALHDGPIPMRLSGLGTRRLLTLGVQREVASGGGVILVDEVEHGLEPFRVRRLLRELLSPRSTIVPTTIASATGAAIGTPVVVAPAAPRIDSRSVILTSHSPVTLTELQACHLRVVRRDARGVRVLQPNDAAQRILRTAPEAFLSRRVVVCEGKTELGLLRGLDAAWSQTGEPFAARGVGLADAGGRTKVGSVTRVFLGLEYPTAILADSDQPLDEPSADLAAAGATVVRWADPHATEDQLFADLPWDGVVSLVQIAIDEHGVETVRQHVATGLKRSLHDVPMDPASWGPELGEATLRPVLGLVSRNKNTSWFKRVDLGEAVGVVVARHLDSIPQSDLALKLAALRAWVSAGD